VVPPRPLTRVCHAYGHSLCNFSLRSTKLLAFPDSTLIKPPSTTGRWFFLRSYWRLIPIDLTLHRRPFLFEKNQPPHTPQPTDPRTLVSHFFPSTAAREDQGLLSHVIFVTLSSFIPSSPFLSISAQFSLFPTIGSTYPRSLPGCEEGISLLLILLMFHSVTARRHLFTRRR